MAERDFLAKNNQCGQTLLSLVARGNAVIAELLRLSSFIPTVFREGSAGKYELLIIDFNYFKTPEFYDQRIATDPVFIYLY